jgi:hypothetical protein
MSKVAAKEYSLWLSPDIVDFSRKISIETKGATKRIDAAGSTRVMLEDVRRRGDRQHPFWYRVDIPLR